MKGYSVEGFLGDLSNGRFSNNGFKNITSLPLDYLSRLNVREVEKRIYEFESLDFYSLTDEQLKHAFFKVIAADVGSAKVVSKVHVPCKIGKNHLFVRARRLSENLCDSYKQIYNEIDNVYDLGPPPNGGIGRLNQEGERLLYTVVGGAGALSTVLKEARIRLGEYFALTFYQAVHDLEFINISESAYPGKHRNPEYDIKIGLINDFIGRLFFKKSEEDFSRVYKVSNVILKSYFNIVGDTLSGWLYPSTKSYYNMNACILSSRMEHDLRVVRAFVCRRYSDNGVNKINIESYVQVNRKGELNFLCNSLPIHRRLIDGYGFVFSEMRSIRPDIC